MRRLIVHADDLGLTPGVVAGIRCAATRGIVTGTSAMVCVPRARERIRALGPALDGRIGLHLQLTGGRPCLPPAQVPSLVAEDGCFPPGRARVGTPDPAELAAEWRAQAARLADLGLRPAHLDTHHDLHQRPEVFAVYVELARALGVPARPWDPGSTVLLRRAGVRCADRYWADWTGAGPVPGVAVFLERLAAVFAAAGADAVVELACHPGLVDAELQAVSTYAAPRADELALLTHPGLAARIAALGIRLCTMGEGAR